MQDLRALMIAMALAASVLLVGGCGDPLFPKGTTRTPYERYQILHGQYRTQKQVSATGASVPALRERLRPMDQP